MNKIEARYSEECKACVCDDGISVQNGSIDHMAYVGHIVTKKGMV